MNSAPRQVLAIIPARAGSKRLPNKNLKPLAGLSLLGHTVRAAIASAALDRVVVSTDSSEIAKEALAQGAQVPFLRSPGLARDDSSTQDVVVDLLQQLAQQEGYRPSHVAILQPTSPLRQAHHIDEACELLWARSPDGAVVSVTDSKPPGWVLHLDGDGKVEPAVGTRLSSGTLAPGVRYTVPNGAIYLAAVPYLLEHQGVWGPRTMGYWMDPLVSVDIDTEQDFRLAELLLGSSSG